MVWKELVSKVNIISIILYAPVFTRTHEGGKKLTLMVLFQRIYVNCW